MLGIFDRGSAADAPTVMRAATTSIATVSARLPVTWNQRVVVYALSDGAALHKLGGIPGGNPDNLSAVSFPVYAADGRLASERVLVHPRYISSIQPEHDHLLTHEMTHVATERITRGGPVWASEGLAEWIATGTVTPYTWGYTKRMIDRARRGAHAMPSTHTFNTFDVYWNYALSLMASDYIAHTYGPQRLWQVFVALQKDDYTHTDQQKDRVLRRLIGIDSHELARRAAAHMVASSVFARQ
ncbi:MAG: hypothetical protein ACXVXG_14385 [Nocardioidaceae bacterium]